MSNRFPLRPFRTGLRLAVQTASVLPLLAGCTAIRGQVRGLGGSAFQGGLAYLDSEPGRQRVRAVSDSSLASLTQAYRTQVSPVLDSTLLRVSTDASTLVRRTQDSLAAAIQGPFSASLQSLLRANVRVAGEEGRAQLALTTGALEADLRDRFVPVLVAAVGASVDTALSRATAGEARLRPALDSVVASAVRSGIRAGVSTAKEEGEPFWRKVRWAGGAALAVVLAVAAAWLWVDRRKRGEALAAVAAAVNSYVQAGGGAIKQEIKAQAQSRQIEGYLLSFLEQQGLRPRQGP
jgi:hypothetical protein